MSLIRNNDTYGKIKALEETWRELKSESDVERLIDIVNEKREVNGWGGHSRYLIPNRITGQGLERSSRGINIYRNFSLWFPSLIGWVSNYNQLDIGPQFFYNF